MSENDALTFVIGLFLLLVGLVYTIDKHGPDEDDDD